MSLKGNPVFIEVPVPIGTLVLSKHLAGRHDQSSHAGGGSSTTKPSSNQSKQTKNLEVAARMSDTYDKTTISKELIGKKIDSDLVDWKPTSMVQGVEVTAKCDYKTESGSTIRLELLNETDNTSFRYTRIKAYDPSVGSEPIAFFESITNKFSSNPMGEQRILLAEVDEPYRRQGIGTAMLEFGRRETGAIRHSDNLSDDGKAFAEVSKHLFGQHDQITHGNKGIIKAGFENWIGQVDSILKSAKTIDPSRGNAIQNVIVERAGFNGKPEMVGNYFLNTESPELIHRGVAGEEFKQDFLESEVQYGGIGNYGNGSYFGNAAVAMSYADPNMEMNPEYPPMYRSRIIEAAWKPDANVKHFTSMNEINEYRQAAKSKFLGLVYEKNGNKISTQEVNKIDKIFEGDNWTNYLIMDGFDGYDFDTATIGSKLNKITVVLNRGKLKVASD